MTKHKGENHTRFHYIDAEIPKFRFFKEHRKSATFDSKNTRNSKSGNC